MPVYLCQPGANASEPWRHGIQVYAAPFAMDDAILSSAARDMVSLPSNTSQPASWQPRSAREDSQDAAAPSSSTIVANSGDSTTASQRGVSGVPIRRVRHAEVILVDDVCIAHDRYWLRLRWPGGRGGFAGYIALGKVSETNWMKKPASINGTSNQTIRSLLSLLL